MNRIIVNIGGVMYIFAFKNKDLTIFNYKDKLEKIDLSSQIEYNLHIENIIEGLTQIVKKDILDKIKNNFYNNEEEIKRDFLNTLKSYNIENININFETFKSYQDNLKELNSEFQKHNDDVKQKEELIETKLEVDLKTLFQQHGINEFEITDTKSAITYENNGIPHVITHTNPNTNIYETVLRSINFDKLHSKEDLDREIDNSFYREKDRFTEHQTQNTNQTKDTNINEILDFLRKNYNITQIYNVMPSNDTTIGESLLVDFGNGWQLISIERDINGVITSVELGTRKNLDNQRNTTLGTQDIKTETISDELSNEAKQKQIKDILLKLYQNEELTNEDKSVIDKYSNEAEFYTLPLDARQMFKEILELYENLQIELHPEMQKEGKAYKIEPPKNEDKNAFIEIGIVTFLSGTITGVLLYIFFQLIV